MPRYYNVDLVWSSQNDTRRCIGFISLDTLHLFVLPIEDDKDKILAKIKQQLMGNERDMPTYIERRVFQLS